MGDRNEYESDWCRSAHVFRTLDGRECDWRDMRPVTPRRRRNQYTPVVERPWLLVVLGAATLAILWARSQGYLP